MFHSNVTFRSAHFTGWPKRRLLQAWALLFCCIAAQHRVICAQQPTQSVIIDTDIGDDVDDVFAVGLALSSPELRILGIASAWGDTELKARLLDRLLCETGRTDIPVAVGIRGQGTFTQRRWAERQPAKEHPDAVTFLLEQVKQHPGEITLIGLGPLTNVAAALKKDPETFRKLKRIVIMGGSIRKGYNDLGFNPSHGPDAEYNIVTDIPAAQQVFTSGVPLYVMPLDATQLKLDDSKRQLLFAQSTNLTDAMALLYAQWSLGHQLVEPTLYDDVAVAYAINSDYCPVTELRIVVDDKGFTRETLGPPTVHVCLKIDSDPFFQLFMQRLLNQRLSGFVREDLVIPFFGTRLVIGTCVICKETAVCKHLQVASV